MQAIILKLISSKVMCKMEEKLVRDLGYFGYVSLVLSVSDDKDVKRFL